MKETIVLILASIGGGAVLVVALAFGWEFIEVSQSRYAAWKCKRAQSPKERK